MLVEWSSQRGFWKKIAWPVILKVISDAEIGNFVHTFCKLKNVSYSAE